MNVSGLSPIMQKLATQVRLAAETDASVFIGGESGAGEEEEERLNDSGMRIEARAAGDEEEEDKP
ncbi:hypothetical protein EII09_29800, partial [Klebsiella pneumoniae]|nr:hypothetical protein [Klebsiella pneumoniae]